MFCDEKCIHIFVDGKRKALFYVIGTKCIQLEQLFSAFSALQTSVLHCIFSVKLILRQHTHFT